MQITLLKAVIPAAVLIMQLSPVSALTAQGDSPLKGTVPLDLRQLLTPVQSEMRLVTQRYTADRVTLNGNYIVSAGGRGGQAAAQPSGGPPPLSRNRIARLKRFDMDWQAALAKLDAARLTPAGRLELDALKTTIDDNLKQLDADAHAIAEVMPLVPFAPAIINLSEARVRMEDVDARAAAAAVTAITKQINDVRKRIEAATDGEAGSAGALQPSQELAQRGAAAVESLRTMLTAWFGFYNGYDPLFTWWMGVPYKEADTALTAYAASLRERATGSGPHGAPAPKAGTVEIPPAPAPKVSSVPNLQQIIALPQDEMTGIVQRFVGQGTGGRGGRGGAPQPPRDRQFYLDWRTALNTLDFDALSRNAQVDYLFIRKSIETGLARLDTTPQPAPPRKTDDSGIPGAARGRDGLIQDLREEMIPYTPEQLIALGEQELAWCIEEFKKASRQMGFGDDWKSAIEKVKDMHVPPGGQPAMIRDLLKDAIDYLVAKDLITVPPVAAESLRMAMMSPERQLVNPFFTGGAQITVSYPTDTMTYDQRIQSMRGNNDAFSNATAGHEMIPGHNLVGYMGARYGGLYRARIGGNTPFFGEGWPVYWETILYDKGFHDTPEKRIGALFWRMHRCARIIFSLKFHMGQWSPQESIDFLVDTVGHERDNATAEVRRSFEGNYSPLYQAAYLLGALQLRGLRKEVVDSGQMTEKQFHDELMRQGSMPIALLRLALTKQKLTRDMPIDWKFYGDLKQ